MDTNLAGDTWLSGDMLPGIDGLRPPDEILGRMSSGPAQVLEENWPLFIAGLCEIRSAPIGQLLSAILTRTRITHISRLDGGLEFGIVLGK